MGALPSHETHERGLYSHRHGRNRRNEIILIPLTTAFFPSPDCPLFQHLYNSRYRRTAKYYFRALRSAQTPRESDYFCTTTAINEEEEFEKFYKEYLEKRELPSGKSAQAQAQAPPPAAAAAGVGYLSAPLLASAAGGPQSTGGAGGGVPSPQSPQDCLNAQGKPPKVGPMDFRSFSDSREGLYQILISDNEAGVFDTDEELRQAYWKQVQQQQTERQRLYQSQQGRRPPAAGSGASAGAPPPPPPPPPPQPSLPPPSPSMRPSSTAPVASDAFATRAMAPPSATSAPAAAAAAGGGGSTANPLSPGAVPPPPSHPSTAAAATTMSMDDLSFDEFVSGYLAAKRYMKGKPVHTRFSKTAAADVKGDPIHPADGAAGSAAVPNEYAASHYKHVTAPCAYDVRPLPCVIASRYDPGKPQPVDDPLYVPFGDSYVKIMGMFGFFPATVGMRRSAMRGTTTTTAAAAAGSRGAGGHEECEEGSEGRDTQLPRRFPRKEGNNNGDDDVDEDVEIEQHLLKGTMFVDKDVGDQILGNMVMLATYMYVRQCIEARINPQSIPMLPVMMRFPLSNIPMLQFVREFRVRLRSLLEAGTAKAGQKPVHIGMSGFNPEDLAEPHHPQLQKLEEEGYLFEPDIPTASTFNQLFMSAEQAKSTSAPLRRHAGMNTNECGRYPIIMMSGFNVQSTPLRHPALNSTGYPPAVAAAAMVAAASMSHRGSPQSRSMPASPQTNEMPNSTSAGGVGRVPTFPPTAPPPPLPGHGGAAAAAAASGAGGANAASTTTAAAGMPPLPPPPPAPGALEVGPTTPEEEARKIALLHRRKQRFRIWVEDGHMCIWASAAYARRAALIMSQQLNTTVDSNSVPEQRSWNYRGLLHAGTVVPPPRHVNDVIIVAEDIPRMGLWQGDVLRCCTAAELRVMTESHGTQPLPLPCSTEDAKEKSLTAANHGTGAGDVRTGSQASMTSMAASKTATEPVGVPGSPTNSMSVCEHGSASGAADPNASSGHINFTSNHVSNPLLQEKELAPPTAFWVRGAGGLDDSFTNITETNMPPHPKAEKQLQQAAMQRAKKAAAAVAAAQSSGKKRRGLTAEAAAAAAAQLFVDIDRREGTLNIEEVVLAWIKVVAILTRDSTEEDRAWVRDPQGNPVRVDRYVIRRYEHDGVRFFIGVTPRFVGQQRRIEKVLGEVYALEEREGRRRRQQLGGDDNDDDDDGFGGDGGDDHDGHDYHSPHQRHNNSHHASSDGRGFAGSPHLGSLSLVSHQADPISYALGRQSAGNVGAGQYNDVWGAPGAPPTMMAPAALSSAVATPPSEAFRKATPLAGGASPLGSAALPSGGSNGGASGGVGGGAGSTNESSSRLAFAAVFGGGGGSNGGGGKVSANAGYASTKGAANNAELTGPGFEVDDLLERYKSDALFFGDGDDD